MAIEKIVLAIEAGFALQAAHATQNGDILAVIDNYGTSSLRWTNGAAPTTKIVRYDKNYKPTWQYSIPRTFDAKKLEAGLGGEFVFAGQTSDLPIRTRARDLVNQVIYTFSKDGRLVDQLTLDGNGIDYIERIQLSDRGIAWITAISDSTTALGTNNYNSAAPIDPFAPGKPDNSKGNDILVIRVDAVNGGRASYRIGAEDYDGSVGGKIIDTDDSFILRAASAKTTTPKINGEPITFESPFKQAPSNGYFIHLGSQKQPKAYYHTPSDDPSLWAESVEIGEKTIVDSKTSKKFVVSRKLLTQATTLAESNNKFYIDTPEAMFAKWTQFGSAALTAFTGSALTADAIEKLDPFNSIADNQKIILYGTEYEMAYGTKISGDGQGNIYFVGQLKKSVEAGSFTPYDGLSLVKASIKLPLESSANSMQTETISSMISLELKLNTAISSLLDSMPTGVGPTAGQTKDLTIADGATLNVQAPGWADTIRVNRIARASDRGERLEIRQPDADVGFSTKTGSLIVGGAGKDIITGGFGWDIVDSGAGDDLVKTGNGRDVLSGGLGADELWGGFGWNTYRSEKDGSKDLLVIRSDQWIKNPRLNNTSGNNADGSKADVIEELDAIDRIIIQGATTAEISVLENVTTPAGVNGIGIYAKGALEALYVGKDLTLHQLHGMVSGDNSMAAINQTIPSYGGNWVA